MLSILSNILIALLVTVALFWGCLWGKGKSSSVDKRLSFFSLISFTRPFWFTLVKMNLTPLIPAHSYSLKF